MVTHSESLTGGPPQNQSRRLYRGDGWRTLALGILCVLMIAPLVMAVIISLKSPSQFTARALPPHLAAALGEL